MPLRVAAPVRPHVSRRHLACSWLCGVVPALRHVATGGIVSFHQSSACGKGEGSFLQSYGFTGNKDEELSSCSYTS